MARAIIGITRLHPGRDADLPLPRYMTSGAAGADVVAALDAPITLQPLERTAISTGLALAIPPGFEVQVRPRSGLALKSGLTILNAPGTIDSDYRGELRILLVNLGHEPAQVARGDRIAQLVMAKVEQAEFEEVASLSATERGQGGFGSTGQK